MAGTKTYAELKQELKLNLSGRSALETPTDWYGEFINKAYQQLCTRTRLFQIPFLIFIPELETSASLSITASTAYVTVPTAAFIVRGIHNTTNDRPLTWIPWADYLAKTGRSTSASYAAPRNYTRANGYIYLYPTPDTSYTWTIYYKKRVSALSASDDVTEIGPEWDEPIVQLATIFGMNALKEYDFAEIEKKHFVEDVTGLCNTIYQERMNLNSHLQPSSQYLGRWKS